MAVQSDYGAGDLRWEIRIEQPTYNAAGDEIDPAGWRTFRQCWSVKEPVQGRELVSSDAETNELFSDFVIRRLKPYPDTTMRLVNLTDSEEVYDIRAVKPTTDLKWIRLTCRLVRG